MMRFALFAVILAGCSGSAETTIETRAEAPPAHEEVDARSLEQPDGAPPASQGCSWSPDEAPDAAWTERCYDGGALVVLCQGTPLVNGTFVCEDAGQ